MTTYTGILTWEGGKTKTYEKSFRSQLEGIFKRSGGICIAIYKDNTYEDTIWKQDKLKWTDQ